MRRLRQKRRADTSRAAAAAPDGLAPQARLAILRACHESQSRTLPGVVEQEDVLL
ncbi:MAG: hypothetical protein Q8M91_06480 [Polaromonas sp.]|nr:hypothetical protein [Polaromonas sp.]